MSKVKHIVCHSGGIGSALVAIEVVRKYGTEGVVLLNHDINPWVEDADIKRFKQDVADYCGLPITYANINDEMVPEKILDQFEAVMLAKAFKVGTGTELCTSKLKTEPFRKWLNTNVPQDPGSKLGITAYYGFDEKEMHRVERRRKIMKAMGYKTAFPLVEWDRTIQSLDEVGIEPPGTYGQFKHANCVGCLKAGKQHWYVVYCTRPDVWKKAVAAEEYIGYTLHRDTTLPDLGKKFEIMKQAGIEATENIQPQTFWAKVRKICPELKKQEQEKPCECST